MSENKYRATQRIAETFEERRVSFEVREKQGIEHQIGLWLAPEGVIPRNVADVVPNCTKLVTCKHDLSPF